MYAAMISTAAAVTAWTHDERRHRGVVGVAIRREPRAQLARRRRAPPRAASAHAEHEPHPKAAGRCRRRAPGSRPPTSPLLPSHAPPPSPASPTRGASTPGGGQPSARPARDTHTRTRATRTSRARTAITTIMAHHEWARGPVMYTGSRTPRATSTGPPPGPGSVPHAHTRSHREGEHAAHDRAATAA